jgi:membrane protein required for colicin V production
VRAKEAAGMFDIVVFAVVGILTVIGLWKGMVRQLFGLAGVIAGYLLAMKFYQPCSGFLTGSIHPGIARAISFIAIFLACLLAAHLIAWAVGRLFTISKLGFLNRTGGGLLGFVKGCIIVAVAVMVLTTFLSPDNALFKKSSTIAYILPCVSALKKVTKGEIKARYNEKIDKGEPVRPKEK